jgi:hypothetical protein
MIRPLCLARLRAFFAALALLVAWLAFEAPAHAQGGDTCAAPPLLTTAGDTGTTLGATNDTSTVSLACNGIYTSVVGPDVFYEVIVGAGNNFTITVTPTYPYDTSIYLMAPMCGVGADCESGWGADDFGPGDAETLSLIALPPGAYYLGIDSFYGAGDPDNRESGAYTVAVSGSLGLTPTTTSVQAIPSPSVYGESVSIIATVSASAGTPAGTVTFSIDGGPATGVALDPTGQATLPTSTLGEGIHTVSANYLGSAAYLPSSGTAMAEVTQATTTTTLMSSGSPSMLGTSVTFTSNVSVNAPGAGTPTGTVTFTIDGTPQTPVGLDPSSNAAFSTSALTAGPHTIVAAYSGDGNFTGSTSTSIMQVVMSAATTTTVAAAPEPTVYGQSVTFTATVSGGTTPTGSVSFSLDGGPGSPVMLTGGQATFTTSALAPGTHTMAVAYGGDGAHAASSGSTMHVVVQASTVTTLMITPSIALQVVNLSATVTATAPGAGTPSGVVTFSDGGTVFGSATLMNGVATLPCAFDAGLQSISAAYGGDTFFLGSMAAAQSETVPKADTTTALTTSATPSPVGALVVLTASVSVNAPALGTPTGTVTFTSGTTTLGTGMLDGSGHAVLSTSALAAGTYSITATYGGDGDRTASTSTPLSEVISNEGVAVVLTSSANPAALGANVTFTATVSVQGGAGTPTGSVSFTDGPTMLGTGTLAGGVATFATSALTGGPHTITATYGGDGTYMGGALASLVETITQAATTTALTAMPNPASFGSPITLTATVSSTGTGTPTGTVGFVDGTSSLGTATLTGGMASLVIPSLSVGIHPIQAAYSGDSSFGSSVSAVVTEQVISEDDAGTSDSGTPTENDGAAADGTIEAAASDGGSSGSDAGAPDGAENDAIALGDAMGQSDATTTTNDGSVSEGGETEDGSTTEGDGGGTTKGKGSCGCRTVGGPNPGGGFLAIMGFAAVVSAFGARRRSSRG